MKRFVHVLIVSLLSSVLISCGGDNPGQVSMNFVQKLASGDTDGAIELSTAESQAMIGLMQLSGATA